MRLAGKKDIPTCKGVRHERSFNLGFDDKKEQKHKQRCAQVAESLKGGPSDLVPVHDGVDRHHQGAGDGDRSSDI